MLDDDSGEGKVSHKSKKPSLASSTGHTPQLSILSGQKNEAFIPQVPISNHYQQQHYKALRDDLQVKKIPV